MEEKIDDKLSLEMVFTEMDTLNKAMDLVNMSIEFASSLYLRILSYCLKSPNIEASSGVDTIS